VADMVKIFFKEDWVPDFVDKPTFWLAPFLAMSMMMLAFLIVPIAPGIGVADLDLGVALHLRHRRPLRPTP